MRRFMTTALLSAATLVGMLSLSGCIVEPPRGHYRERVVVHDRYDHHDHDHDHDHDHNWH